MSKVDKILHTEAFTTLLSRKCTHYCLDIIAPGDEKQLHSENITDGFNWISADHSEANFLSARGDAVCRWFVVRAPLYSELPPRDRHKEVADEKRGLSSWYHQTTLRETQQLFQLVFAVLLHLQYIYNVTLAGINHLCFPHTLKFKQFYKDSEMNQLLTNVSI